MEPGMDMDRIMITYYFSEISNSYFYYNIQNMKKTSPSV